MGIIKNYLKWEISFRNNQIASKILMLSFLLFFPIFFHPGAVSKLSKTNYTSAEIIKFSFKKNIVFSLKTERTKEGAGT